MDKKSSSFAPGSPNFWVHCVGYCGLQYVAYAEGVVRAYNIQSFAVLYTLQSEWNFFSHCMQDRELYFVVVVSLLRTESSLGSLLLGSWSIFHILLSLVIYICVHIYK